MVFGSNHWVVGREPGPGTATGAGDILIDNHGNRYRVVDDIEASMIRNSTGGHVYTVRDGRIVGR